MIEFPLLADVIRMAGPEGRSLSALEKTPTSRALVGILTTRVGFEMTEERYGEAFDLFVCEDRSPEAVRIPRRFAILCLDTVSVNAEDVALAVVNRVNGALIEQDVHQNPVILLATGPLGEVGQSLIYPGSQFFDYQPHELLKVLLSYPPRAELMRRVVTASSLHLLNPYIYKGPVDANLFVGRARQLEELCASRASYALIGPRAMGKTSLMNRAYERLLREGRVAVQCEYGAAISEHGFIKQILQEFIQLHGCSPKLLSERLLLSSRLESLLRDLCRREGEPVTLFIDEADELDQRCPALTQVLKQTCDFGWARVVLVGHKQLRRATSDVKCGQLVNVVQNLSLTSLDFMDCSELLRKPMSALHIRLENPDKMTRVLMRESGGSPSRMQLLCHYLVEDLSRSGSADRRLTLEHAERAVHLPEVRSEIISWYRYSTSALEKWLAAVAAPILPAHEHAIIEAAQHDIPEVSSQTIQAEIHDLTVANVLDYRPDETLDFAFPAMRALAAPGEGGDRFLTDLREPAIQAVRALNLSLQRQP
jgi:hypothetical protein